MYCLFYIEKMSEEFQSSIQQLSNNVHNNMRILIDNIHNCYSPLVGSAVSNFLSTVSQDFLKFCISCAQSHVKSEGFIDWFSLETDLYKLSKQTITEDSLKQVNQLMNIMVGHLFIYLTSFRDNLLQVEMSENDRIRLMFISELFIVAQRDIYGEIYYENLICGAHVCHTYIIDALHEMHNIRPASTAQLNDYCGKPCFTEDRLKRIAQFWGVCAMLTANEQENIRITMHALLRIYERVAAKYSLTFEQLTNYLLEKQSRNKIVHYAAAIKTYSRRANFNTFSLDNFIQIPENNHINNAINQEKITLESIFRGACQLQKSFPYKM